MHVRTADFTADYADIRGVRFAVFVAEQQVPEHLELDDRDSLCTHVLAFADDETAIGTGRIDVDGKIGRVAVAASTRRSGVGRALMDRLHAIAKERSLEKVWCNAQLVAVPFYERLGYRTAGSAFYEAGIEHVRMEKCL
jgi:predicted GNAT family N-acyltransferase